MSTKRKQPTARTLESLRGRGWPAQVVEKWLPGRRAKKDGSGETEATPYGVRKDLFGCIDILALDGRLGCLGIQACSGSDVATRAKKATAEPLLLAWLRAGNRFEVWGWREIWVPTGAKTKAVRWRPRVVEVLCLVDGGGYRLEVREQDEDEATAPQTITINPPAQPALFEEERP